MEEVKNPATEVDIESTTRPKPCDARPDLYKLAGKTIMRGGQCVIPTVDDIKQKR